MQAISVELMKKVDAQAINDIGIPSCVLMENAGRSIYQQICKIFQADIFNKTFLILAGCGNNGGDGFVLAKYFLLDKIKHTVFTISPKNTFSKDAALNKIIYENLGGKSQLIQNENDLKELENNIEQCNIIVDSIFGTGLSKDITGIYKNAIDLMNARKENQALISIDIPSGLNGNTGLPQGVSVRADHTITMAFPKIGFFQGLSSSSVGDIYIADIGIERQLETKDAVIADIINYKKFQETFIPLITDRSLSSHKGTFGHLYTIGGSEGKLGAVKLATRSALKSGTGLSTALIPRSLMPAYQQTSLEDMSVGLEDNYGFISEKSIDHVLEILETANALVLGPGLSFRKELFSFIDKIIASLNVPILIDADGLNILSTNINILDKKKNELILTPHPKEMARLINKDVSFVQNNRIQVAQEFSNKFGLTVVLKGYRTIVANKNGETSIITSGNPGMATAGSGDVLSGIIGSFLAMKIAPYTASVNGAFLHGACGDLASITHGEESMTAKDIYENLPIVLKLLKDKSSWSFESNLIPAKSQKNWDFYLGKF
ncbi:MAG: NAD(P)H-hydrate dehydratase [Pseudomonadota bacterium]